MFKTQRVLLILAIVVCLLETLSIVVDWIQPVPQAQASAFSSQALPGLYVYWLGGFVCWVAGVNFLKNIPLLGHCFTIGGIYLMILGNNGGLFGSGALPYRFISSILTLVILIIISVRLSERSKLVSSSTEKQ